MAFYMGEIRKTRKEFFDAYRDGEYKKALFLGKHLLHIYEENEDCACMEYAVDMSNLANIFDRMQIYDRAVFYYQKAAELKKECSGESLSYADTLNNLAIVFNQLGAHEQALALHQQVLEIREKRAPGDADVVYSLYHIGNSYEMLQEREKAIAMQEQALRQARACEGFSATDLADIYGALGRLYGELGNYKKGIYFYEVSLDLIEKGRGQDSLLYIMQAMKLAILCEKAGWLALAIEYGEKALEIRRRIFSTDHMDYIKTVGALAILCARAKEYEKAIALHREMVDWTARILGRSHPLYADALHYLGMDYADSGDFAQALDFSRAALQCKQEQNGEDSPQAAAGRMCLGRVYEKMGRYAEALAEYQKALVIRRAQPRTDGTYADTLSAIGSLLMEQGNLQQAELYLSEAILQREENGDTQSDPYIWDLQMLAELLQSMGEHDRAIALSRRSVESMEARYGANHPRYAYAVGRMAHICEEAGYWKEAAEMLEGAVTLQKELLDEDNPQYLRMLEQLAEVYTRQGEYEKAIRLYQEKNDVNFEESAEELLAAANNLLAIANCYKLAGDAARADAYFQEAEAKQKRSGIAPDTLYEKRRQQFFREEREKLLDAPPPQVEKGNAEDYQRAVEYYSAQALAVREKEGESPEFARLLLKTAIYHAHLGHRQDTDTLLDRVLLLCAKEGVLTTDFGKLCDRAGRIFAQVGSMKKAESALRQAYQIQQNTDRCMTKEGYALLLRLLRARNDEKAYRAVKNGEKLE